MPDASSDIHQTGLSFVTAYVRKKLEALFLDQKPDSLLCSIVASTISGSFGWLPAYEPGLVPNNSSSTRKTFGILYFWSII
jgi:hypothetical protein